MDLFAAKEAAYKAVVKCRGKPVVLSLPLFRVDLDQSRVTFEDISLSLAVTLGETWVHAVAWRARSLARWAPTVAVDRLPAGIDPSAGVRALAQRLIGRELGVDPRSITIERDPITESATGLGPPYALCDKRRAHLDISLSHDGNFVACAIG